MASQTRDVTTLSWEGFRDLFSQKYYNVAVRAAKVNEFVSLVQGNMTVTEYALKFDRLAKFAPDLVPTDAARQDRFIRGLNAMIARDVRITTVPGGTTYAQAVEKALTAEEAENKIWKESAVRRKGRRVVPPYFGSGKGGGPGDFTRKTPETLTAAGPDRRGRGG